MTARPKLTSSLRKWILSSPPAEWALNQLRELLIGALRQGPVPKHVAFVMDGNRRFAKNNRMETIEGHNLGFEALAKVRANGLSRTHRRQELRLMCLSSRSSKSAINQASTL
jgi:undecaprenyl pyrophosphate synthase